MAVLAVVLFHARVPGIEGGYVGVDVFFVISGFVIGSSLLREVHRTGSISVRRFYARRIRRLLPAWVFAAVTTLVLSALFLEFGAVQETAGRTAVAATLSVANLYLLRTGDRYFNPTEESNPFLHTWSLGVEEQFYLVAPGLLVVLLIASRSTRWPFRTVTVAVVGTFAAASLALSVRWVGTNAARTAFYHPAARFWEIAIGLCLAFVAPVAVRWMRWWWPVGLAGLLLSALHYDAATQFPGMAALLPVVSTAMLVVVLPASRAGTRWFGSPALVWIGDRSYGWYLWHWPLIVVAAHTVGSSAAVLALAAVVSLVPAAVSYRWVEQPVRRGAWSGGWLHPASAGLAAFVGLLALSGAFTFSAERAWGVDVASLRLAHPDGVLFELGCHAADDVDLTSCTFAPAIEPDGMVLLVGDSLAAAIADGVILGANDLGYAVVAVSANACPHLPVRLEGRCEPMWQRVKDLATRLRPDLVLMAHMAPAYINWYGGTPMAALRDSSGAVIKSPTAGAAVWAEGIERARSDLEAMGLDLAVIDPTPMFPRDEFDRGPTLLAQHPAPAVVSVAELAAYRDPARSAEHSAIRPDFSMDPASELCGSDTCSAAPRGDLWYFDHSHLNRQGSEALRRFFRTELRRVLAAR